MKRLVTLAALSLALWAGATASAQAGSSAFGLCYNRDCGGCGPCGGICVRPYNAFSSVTCGIANVGGCNNGRCGPGDEGHCHGLFGEKRVCDWHGNCRTRPCAPFHKHKVGPNGEGWCDDGSGAFVIGPQMPFWGSPGCGNACYTHGCWNPGPWGVDAPKSTPGYEPPPGPNVPGMPPHIPTTWLPARPFPGVYGGPNPMVNYPSHGTYGHTGNGHNNGFNNGHAPAQQPAPAAQNHVAPASYQQPQQQGYNYQPMWWWYPVSTQYQGWYYGMGQ